MKKTVLALALLASCGAASIAQAGPLIPTFNLFKPAGADTPGAAITLSAQGLDWNAAGTGVAYQEIAGQVNPGPFLSPLAVGDTFEFRYQANLVAALGASLATGNVDTAVGGTLGAGNYQLTIVAHFPEVVTSSLGGIFAAFGPGSGTPAKISIFYDDSTIANTQANQITGTGFDDGIEIAEMTIDAGDPSFPTTSSFVVNLPGASTGNGSARIHATVSALDDFVNTLSLVGIGGIIEDMHFQANLNFPPSPDASTGYHIGGEGAPYYSDYTVNSACTGPNTCDLQFQVDGSNRFSAVPEPGTILLIGLGLFAVGFASRRSGRV